MAPHGDVLWTGNGLRCLMTATATGYEVCVQVGELQPFIRKTAHSRGDARNQGEYLRVLLERSRHGVPRAPARPPLVLIVEDDPDNLFAYEEMLRIAGFQTASAASVVEAERLAAQVKPSAVVLDHVLPDGTGASVCAALRHHAGDELPIIVVTGLDPRDVQMGTAAGPDAVMSKPCRPDLVTALLNLLLKRGKAEAATPTAAARPTLAHAISVRCPLCGASGAQLQAEGHFACATCGVSGLLRRDQFVDAG